MANTIIAQALDANRHLSYSATEFTIDGIKFWRLPYGTRLGPYIIHVLDGATKSPYKIFENALKAKQTARLESWSNIFSKQISQARKEEIISILHQFNLQVFQLERQQNSVWWSNHGTTALHPKESQHFIFTNYKLNDEDKAFLQSIGFDEQICYCPWNWSAYLLPDSEPSWKDGKGLIIPK